MAKFEIITWPNKILKQKSLEVPEVTKEIQTFMIDLLASMYAANGLGLAAVQVGVLKRILVIDLAHRSSRYKDLESQQEPNPMFFVNPKITHISDDSSCFDEGCLSFPGQFSKVTRPEAIIVEYLDFHGESQKLKATGLLATCLQHEIDHLNGIVFIDHLSRLKRSLLIKKLQKKSDATN